MDNRGVVLVLFLLLAFVFFKIFEDLKSEVARLTKENLELNSAKEKAQELAHFKTQFESLSISYDSLSSVQDSLIKDVYAFSQDAKVLLFKTFVSKFEKTTTEFKGKKMTKYILQDWVPESDTAKLQGILFHMEWYRKQFEALNNAINTRKGLYSISIIYFKGYENATKQAMLTLQNDPTLVVVKTEEMNKFTYNPKIVYFNDADQKKSEVMRYLLNERLQMKFEVEKSTFISQQRSLEVWIGKENKQLDRTLLLEENTSQ